MRRPRARETARAVNRARVSTGLGIALRRWLAAAHHLLDDADDHHDYGATDATAGDLAHDGADVHSTPRYRCAEARSEHTGQLATPDAANEPGDSVANRPEVVLLQHTPGNVPAHGTAYELNEQRHDVHGFLLLSSFEAH